MTSQELDQKIRAMLTAIPSNPVHSQIVDNDYDNQELLALETCSPEFRDEYLAAVESGVWS